MSKKEVLPLLLLISIFLSTIAPNSLTIYGKVQYEDSVVRLVRTPMDVYSGQATFIFAYISITIRLLRDGYIVHEYPITISRIPMLPIPWARGWCVTAVPGLPAKTVTVKKLLQSVTWKVTSSVSYKLLVDGKELASGTYEVKEGEFGRRLPPLVWSFVSSVLEDPGLINETFGLGSRGWRVGAFEDQKVLIIAMDEKGVKDLSFMYSVSEGAWLTSTITPHPLMTSFNDLISKLNDVIQTVNSIIPNIELPEIKTSIKVCEAKIPGQPAGKYVVFKAEAIDIDGNKASSPKGFYFVVNQASDTKVLVIDPHVKLWLLLEISQELMESFREYCEYQVPSEILDNVIRVSKILDRYGIIPFHHWELLGKNYNIYVA